MTQEEKNARNSAGFKEMCRVLAKVTNDSLIYDFFECILTPPECKTVAERWLLVREIDKGTPQREIAKMLGISLCKITRGSREYKKEGSAFKKIFNLVPPAASREEKS
jgi:TrpR family trp operon transcriptional repressor